MSLSPSPDAFAVVDTGVDLHPDPGRTIVRFFVAGRDDTGGDDTGGGDSRAGAVVERVLALGDVDIDAALERVLARLGSRHLGAVDAFERHAALVATRLDDGVELSTARRRLLGAAFTHEYAIEAAALCNPSIVRHPNQPSDGSTAFVLSVRGIGEGHRSSIGFRAGVVAADGSVVVAAGGPAPGTGTTHPSRHYRRVLHRKLADVGDDHENAAYVLDGLPECFDDAQLAVRLDALAADAGTRRHTSSTIANLRRLAEGSYRVAFDPATELSDRVLWPNAAMEQHGMEDARFVEITDASAPRYCATYTAYDGADTAVHLLTTDDFVTFEVSPVAGAAARGKGLALFPRRIGGRYAALSRSDRETNALAFSDDLRCWDEARTIQRPNASWEVLQLGNCGSPIETPEGWLVITHGVGPLRTYALGALLLDLDDPQQVIGASDGPLLEPPRHDGYVPNVVYSCGSIVVGGRLVLPYGIGDRTIAVATLDVRELVASMRRPAGRRHRGVAP